MEMRNIDNLAVAISGIDELKTMVGTRTEIYNFIGKANPLAIIDCRQSQVNINGVCYLVILKKRGNSYGVRVIWDVTNNIQYHNN